MRLVSLFVLFAAVTGALPAQGSFTNYGRGCTLPGSPPPLIRATGQPLIGQSYTVRYVGPNSITPVSMDQPALLTGVQQASITVPPISPLQPGNCQILLVPVVTLVMPRAGSAFQGQLTLMVPLDPSLIGQSLFHQFIGLYSSCRPSCVLQMVRTSDGLHVVFG